MPETIRLQRSGASPNGKNGVSGASPGGAPTDGGPEQHHARARRCSACNQVFSGQARFCPFDGELLVEAPEWDPQEDPLIGQTIDSRYKIFSVLGEGETGKVYKVQHVALGRRFALKVLRRDFARDAQMVARFMQEAQAAAAIGHPNIIAVSDFGELSSGDAREAPLPYFVMEFLTGMSLPMLLHTAGPLAPSRAGPIFLQAASALGAAHTAGVIHRNLKPANLFVTRTGDRDFVKLLDFGVAKIVGTGRLTKIGMISGAPHYMSPEQASGQPIDQRVDIYALGVIMYECFTGRVPFEADKYPEILRKHVNEAPQPIEELVPDRDALGAFGPITMRCLAKSPKDRYASMAELTAAIEGALAPFTARAQKGRGRAGESGGRWGTSRGRLALIAAGAVILAVILGAIAWRALREGSRVDTAPPASAPSASISGAQARPADLPRPSGSVQPAPPLSAGSQAMPAEASMGLASGAPSASGPLGAPGASGASAPLGSPQGALAASPTSPSVRPSMSAPAKPSSASSSELVDPWGSPNR